MGQDHVGFFLFVPALIYKIQYAMLELFQENSAQMPRQTLERPKLAVWLYARIGDKMLSGLIIRAASVW